MDFADPANVHHAWLSAVDFLRLNAARIWTWQLDQGLSFVIPDAARGLSSNAARARYLADAERRRLSSAALIHLDAAATAVAVATPFEPCDLTKLAPTSAGLLVWATPPYTTPDGIPIVAASWGEADDGGLWITWWSDQAAAAQLMGNDVDTAVGINGHLGYDREAHVALGSWPTQADNPAHPQYPFYATLLSTWTALAAGDVAHKTEMHAAPSTRKQARRLELPAPAVQCYTTVLSASEVLDSTDVESFAERRDDELEPQFRWIPRLYRATAARMAALEHDLAQRFPGVFALLTEAANERGDWPAWCWLPISKVADILAANYPVGEALTGLVGLSRNAAVLAAIGAWRASGRVVVYPHEGLTPQLEAAADVLPRDLPQRWPVRCVRVAFEARRGHLAFWCISSGMSASSAQSCAS